MALLPSVLSLGDFDFEGYEEPYQLNFGKQQAVGEHILIGGGRVIDTMGANDPDITWSGYFTGFQAEFRARYLESVCKQGAPLTLKTAAYVKQAVITKFTYGYHNIWPIQYTITVKVIQDLTLPVNFLIPGDLTITVLESLFKAETIAAEIGDPSISSAIALAIELAQAAAPFDNAANSAISAALAAAQSAVGVVNAAVGSVESGIFG